MNMLDITIEVFKKHGVKPGGVCASEAFKRFWNDGWKIVLVEDRHYRLEDLEGDTYKPELHAPIPKDQILKERRAFRRKVSEEGVWGMGIAVDGKPQYGTFVWGFVGKEGIGSGYDIEMIGLMEQASLEL